MRPVISLCVLIATMFFCVSSYAHVVPSGGETWSTGRDALIRWYSSDYPSGDIDIHLWDGESGKWYFIASVPAGKEQFTWLVPQGLHGQFFRIKLQSQKQSSVSYMSAGYFSILPASPSGGGGISMPDSERFLVHIFPNPASEFVVATWEGDGASIQISDILGRDVVRLALSGTRTVTIPVQALLSGLYSVTVALSDGTLLYGRFFIETL